MPIKTAALAFAIFALPLPTAFAADAAAPPSARLGALADQYYEAKVDRWIAQQVMQ